MDGERHGPTDRRRVLRLLALTPGAGLALAAGLAHGSERRRGQRLQALLERGDGAVCAPTSGDTAGPFYLEGAPRRSQLAGPDEPGDRIVVRGRVLGPDCKTPLAGALLDAWQADAEGRYHADREDEYRLRGQVLTDAKGRYAFESVVPGRYKVDEGAAAFRPAHIHFTVGGPRHRPLTTQLYFKGDPHLAPHDACGAECNSGDPGRIVELRREQDGPARFVAEFDVVLAKV
ncbi:MAG: twin-arginine translocation pathway signal protein [Gemmatimonadota bacterium]